MLAAVLSAMADQHGLHTAAFKAHANMLAPYEGRGKGRARNHDRGGTRRAQRAALKTRNIKRFRAQSRGSR